MDMVSGHGGYSDWRTTQIQRQAPQHHRVSARSVQRGTDMLAAE